MLGLNWRIPLYRKYLFYMGNLKNWPQVFGHIRNQAQLEKIIIRRGPTLHILDPETALTVLLEIWRDQEYTKYFKGQPPQTVVDVGANIGTFALYAKHIWPKCTLIAYEPIQANFNILERNISENAETGIIPRKMAVSAEEGDLELFMAELSGGHSVWSDEKLRKIGVERVQCTTLQQITSELGWIDFLKLDCEGSEYDILKTAKGLLHESVGYIAMEYHEKKPQQGVVLVDVLEAESFKVIKIPVNNYGTGMIYASNTHCNLR